MEYKFNIPRLGSLSGLNQALSPNPIMPGMDPLTMPGSNLISPNSNMMNMNNLNQSLELPKNLFDPNVQPVRADQIPEYSKFGNLMAGSEFTRTPEQLAQMTQTEFAQFDKDRKDARNTRLGMMLQSLSNSFKGETTDPQDLLAMKQNSRIAKERARMKQKFEEDLKYMNPEMQRKAQLLGAEGYAEVLKQNMIDSFSNKKSTLQKNVASLVEAQTNFSNLNKLSKEERALDPNFDAKLLSAQTKLVGLQTGLGTDAYSENLAKLKRKGEAPGGIDLTEGEKSRDKAFGTELIKFQSDLPDLQQGLTALNGKVEMLETRNDITGPNINVLANIPYVGSQFFPEANSFMRDLESIVYKSLKATLGAQFTQREAENLVRAAIDQSLDEEYNVQRVRRLQSLIQDTYAEKRRQVDYFENKGGQNPYGYGTLKGYEMKETTTEMLLARVNGIPDDYQTWDKDKTLNYINSLDADDPEALTKIEFIKNELGTKF